MHADPRHCDMVAVDGKDGCYQCSRCKVTMCGILKLPIRRMCRKAKGGAHARPAPQLGFLQRVKNFALAMKDFYEDGFQLCTKDQYEERMAICNGCEFRKNNKCLKCGCNLAGKARGRAFKCPIDKWPDLTTEDEGT